MNLNNKNAVVYGAGGSVGSAVAHAFAREGARVFLVGRSAAALEKVAKEISMAGGQAETAQVDALDQVAVEKHIDELVARAGSLDISFNAIGLEDEQGAPLIEMSPDRFLLPIITAMKTQFITTNAAGRQMIKQRSGVILAITATAGPMAYPNVGGFGVACSAIENLCRQQALELGPYGIRVVCLRSAGSPDSAGVKAVFELHAKNAGMSFDEYLTFAAGGAFLKRLPMLAEVANVAAFMASDGASAMTASIANITCGVLVD